MQTTTSLPSGVDDLRGGPAQGVASCLATPPIHLAVDVISHGARNCGKAHVRAGHCVVLTQVKRQLPLCK